MNTPKRQKKAQTNRASWQSWFELFRLPNLFTVPGDILVGWMLAGQQGGFPLLAILSSLGFYSAGLLLNDVADAKIDAKERPSRPIPSKRLSRGCVLRVSILLLLGAFLLAWPASTVALTLIALILFYNFVAKHIAGLGVVVMGLCRGTNILLGASIASQGDITIRPLHLLAFLFFTLYIIGVSIVARNEAQPSAKVRKSLRALPLYFTLALLPITFLYGRTLVLPLLIVGAFQLPLLIFKYTIPQRVSTMIRLLIPFQGLWCLFLYPSMELPILIGFGFLWAMARLSAYRYSGS